MANDIPQAFVDTDIIIRLLTGDDLQKQKQSVRLFEKVEQERLELLAPDTVIADTVYVLSSSRLYDLQRQEIKNLLSPLLSLSAFKVDNKHALKVALDIYSSTNLDFGDALLIAQTRRSKGKIIYSYDHDFNKFPEIIRREP